MIPVRLSDLEAAQIAKGVKHKVNSVTTRHAFFNDALIDALSLPGGQDIISLGNDDGTRQFILGVDSLDDENVTIGIP
jgi:hypothetical protein